jgi:large subunit ribosomal protein L17
MPQPKKAARFGGSPSHHNMILANLTTELIRHGRVRTTLAKARTVQPLAEKMITFGKRGDVHARRQVLRVIRDKDVVHKLFADVGPTFADRQGGYTRVLKLGNRKGDAAPMALIELVDGIAVEGEGDLTEQPRRRWSLRRRKGTLSQGAQEREEERAAAIDRGEDLLGDDDYEDDADDVLGADETLDPDAGVQADPAEVEARLAAQDSEVDAPVEDESDTEAAGAAEDDTAEADTESAEAEGDAAEADDDKA